MEKKKNIVVLTGSPRKEGNSELLADAFIRGAITGGHKITKYQAGKKKIGNCIACNNCYTKGSACIFDDDFNELAPLLESADMIVLATPLYWFAFPAQIKAALDKMYALMVGKRNIKGKESVLLVCAETDDTSDFDGIVRSYELINRYLGWENRGILCVPNVNNTGDILHTNALPEAEELANRVAS